jgi:hypothetical protein
MAPRRDYTKKKGKTSIPWSHHHEIMVLPISLLMDLLSIELVAFGDEDGVAFTTVITVLLITR